MNTNANADTGKNILGPGATPFFPPFGGPNPLLGFGGRSRPGIRVVTGLLIFPVSAWLALSARTLWQLLPEPSSKTCPSLRTVLVQQLDFHLEEKTCLY